MSDAQNEWDWEAFAVAGLMAHLARRTDEARHYWSRAYDLIDGFSPEDPRVAASLSNQALGLLMSGDTKTASAKFDEALRSWEKGFGWTDEMAVVMPARSSLFHQRMEQRHIGAFTTVRRSRHRDLLKGAAALTKFNLGICLLFEEEDARADSLIEASSEERQKAFGPRDVDLATMLGVLAGRSEVKGESASATGFEQRAHDIIKDPARNALELWHDEIMLELNDTRRLLSAAYLTAGAQEKDFL